MGAYQERKAGQMEVVSKGLQSSKGKKSLKEKLDPVGKQIERRVNHPTL